MKTRREAVLNAALQEFYDFGYSGASVRAIADRVGISIAGFQRLFDSKEALFISLVEDWCAVRVEDIAKNQTIDSLIFWNHKLLPIHRTRDGFPEIPQGTCCRIADVSRHCRTLPVSNY